MIGLIESLAGITRLEHALKKPDGVFGDSDLDFIVSLEPAVRDRAHELGWTVLPVVHAVHRNSHRRRKALERLSAIKSRLLSNSQVARLGSRHFVILHVAYRSIQKQLMGDPVTELGRYEGALEACLPRAAPDVDIAVDGPLSILTIANLDLVPERIHVL